MKLLPLRVSDCASLVCSGPRPAACVCVFMCVGVCACARRWVPPPCATVKVLRV